MADKERPTAKCVRANELNCKGVLEVSHPFGRRIQKRFMWVWMCERHHRGDLKNEQLGRFYCYEQASETDLKETYPKTWEMYARERDYLRKKYDAYQVSRL